MRRCLLLVDGTALYVRSSRAGQRTGMNAAGVPTGTLTLFTHSLARMLRAYQPTHVLVAFDGAGSRDWRRSLYAGYKGSRPDPPAYYGTEHQLVFKLLLAAGIANVGRWGFEADDVIAWGWRKFHDAFGDPGAEIVIASDDADMHQLLCGDRQVRQVPLSAGGRVMIYDAVVSRYGCEPGQLPLLRALAGDLSDGIPGVPGVGPVRALGLLWQHDWDLSAVTETMDPVQARLVAAYEDILDLVHPMRAIDYEKGMGQYPLMDVTEWSSGKAAGAADFFGRMRMIKTLAKLEAGSLW
jgi:DNA polymerase-1